jgi:hypothetical protein
MQATDGKIARVSWIPGRRGFGFGEIYLGIALLAVGVARFIPFSSVDGVWPCPMFTMSGVPCPGCGFTRSFFRSAHLDFAGAFLVSPLGTALFLSIVAFSIFGILRWVMRWPWPRPHLGPAAARAVRVGIVLVIAGNWGYLLVRHFVVGDWG